MNNEWQTWTFALWSDAARFVYLGELLALLVPVLGIRGFAMSGRFIAVVFAVLALALGGCSGAASVVPAPPPSAPPPATTTITLPPPLLTSTEPSTEQTPSTTSGNTGATGSSGYANCRWMDDVNGWFCQNEAGGGYHDVPDTGPGLGSCVGMTYYECVDTSSTSESTSEPESSSTTSDCSSSPEVYDPYQCPGDSEADDGKVDSSEIETVCRFHGAATEQEVQECSANY